jgi:hypothetical protein
MSSEDSPLEDDDGDMATEVIAEDVFDRDEQCGRRLPWASQQTAR